MKNLKKFFFTINLMLWSLFLADLPLTAGSGGYRGAGILGGLGGFAIGRATARPRYQPVYQEPVYYQQQPATTTYYVDRSGEYQQKISSCHQQISRLEQENMSLKRELRDLHEDLAGLKKEIRKPEIAHETAEQSKMIKKEVNY